MFNIQSTKTMYNLFYWFKATITKNLLKHHSSMHLALQFVYTWGLGLEPHTSEQTSCMISVKSIELYRPIHYYVKI